MKVYILVIDNKYGTTIDAFDSQSKLDAALTAYCAENWSWEDDPPEDDKALVELYWDRQSGHGEEWHKTEEVEL